MKRQTSQIFVAIVCALLGFLLAYQFKVLSLKNDTDKKINNTDIISEVEGLKKEKEELTATNSKLSEEIKKLEESAAENGKVDLEVKKALDNARIQLGTVDVKGPGVVLTIKPRAPIFGSNVNDTSIDLGEDELVHLVNTLWYYKAEAISVDDYRITTQTGIKNSGNIVWIGSGGKKVSPKDTIVIKAIGDKKKLNYGITFQGVLEYGALMNNYDIDVKMVDDIVIEKATESFRTDFITPVKG